MSILDSKGLYKAYLKLIIYEILRKIMCFFLNWLRCRNDLIYFRFKTQVENLIKEYESTLSDLKKDYTRRFKGGSFNPEGSPNAEAWTQMLDKPFKESLAKVLIY